MNKVIFFVLILYLKEVLLDSCEIHKTCRECIRDASVCDWCASKTYNNEQRCKPKSFTATNRTSCSDNLQDLEGTTKPTKDADFSSDSKNVIIQIKPQRYQLNLRPGQPKNFTFSFKWAEDYPVDLYFLFDSSNTMKKIRNNTAHQSKNIYDSMLKMTKDVYMGMGTFVDKNMLPFTTNVTGNESYSFRHHLNFTREYGEFQKAVDNIKQGVNRDLPEAGLDALAQVIACQNKTGWRIQSRKILILMTDDSYHAAGDGRSAGVFKPYDGKCYTENNVYINELVMDYPSVSMINKLARENHVIVIFAVSLSNEYTRLIDHIIGSKIITLDDTKTDEIVTKLNEIYEDITTKLKLNVNMQTERSGSSRRKNFQISFDPDCTKELSACNVTKKDTKNITGTITVLEYDGYDEATIDIAIEGIAEKLTLDVNIINSCTCEKDVEVTSEYCNMEKRECGVCQCNEPKYGDKCQCNRRTIKVDNDTSTCKTKEMDKLCNGQGTCSCGACLCKHGFAGPYCECNEMNCPMHDNILCGGDERGKCQCDGTCKCTPGWSGNACQCSVELMCLAPNNKVCNNRGECNCGCVCQDIAQWDSRNHQNNYCVVSPCPDCHSFQCKNLADCATCLINNNINDCNCSFVRNNLTYTILDELPSYIYDLDDNADWHVCKKVRVDMGCYTNFTYMYDEDEYKIHLMLQKKRNCAEIQYIFGAVFLLCVLLVGVCTLLGWKLITYLRDRQEYLQFMKDHVPDNAPCDNPLYEPATTEFRNPAFGKQSQ